MNASTRRMTCRIALFIVVTAMTIPSPTACAVDNPPIGTNVGQMYPDFVLPKLDGGLGRLSDYRGHKVLLIHFASW